jgi:putative pyoverdin transport system ATP-binding/permease protein
VSVLSIFARKAPNRVFFAILLGAIAGVSYSLLIPLVIGVLQSPDGRFRKIAAPAYKFLNIDVADPRMALVFAITCLFIVVGRTWSQVMLTSVSMDAASSLRVDMYGRIARAPLAALERVGSARLITALTSDLPRIVAGAQLFPALLTGTVSLIGVLGFLFYLNTEVCWFVLKCIVFGIITYQIPIVFGSRYLVRAGKRNDALQESIQGLIRGFKELKLNDEKRQVYFETTLLANESALLHAQKTATTVLSIAGNYGEALSFFVIGIVSFIFVNYHAVSNQTLIGVVMALLYITGPIALILNAIPQIRMSSVSLGRIVALSSELPYEDAEPSTSMPEAWESLRFEGVTYQYDLKDDVAGFKVGPLDLSLRKNEITFIVGGNGSGKSTLSKLLTLHYHATSGRIYFGDTLITGETINTYRQVVVALYSDYYLFERILSANPAQDEVDRYLRLLELDKKVTYRDGKFSTLSLSDGQRRRMALLAAFVEDAELYLFDEWAADQDPVFKQTFYHEILPSLKAKGKAVVVVTHDDRYFHVADKIIVMAEGRVDRIEIPGCDRLQVEGQALTRT